jgi:predicted RNA methylase
MIDTNEQTSLIPSISIDALLAARDNAQRIYKQMGEDLIEARRQLAVFDVELPKVRVQFPGDQHIDLGPESGDAVNREIDRFVWAQLFRLTNIDTLMDHESRRKLMDQLYQSQAHHRHRKYGEKDEDELPELTRENIQSVMDGLKEGQLGYFQKCVEAVYKSLSWCHRTNEPGAIGKKLIITGAFYSWSRSMQGDSTSLGHHENIHDLERVLHILSGNAPPTHQTAGLRTIGKLTYGKWTPVPNPHGEPMMDIICYRKGTMHIRIKDQALVNDMNRIMAERHPGAIPWPKASKASQWGSKHQAQEPVAPGALAKTDKAARQAFYTPAEVAETVVAKAFPGRDYYGKARGSNSTVLEPSAGEGSLVREALRANCSHVTAIENDPHSVQLLNLLADRVNIHDETKLTVRNGNFFDLQPFRKNVFDVVIMNPPFSKGQEVEHVLHAWTFVKPGGRLVSIMSNAVTFRDKGRYKDFREFLDEHGAEIEPLPEGSFVESGTKVSTVLVSIDKPSLALTADAR